MSETPLGSSVSCMWVISCAPCHAERIRDQGGHALLVGDDVAALSRAWSTLAVYGVSSLGQEMVSAASGTCL